VLWIHWFWKQYPVDKVIHDYNKWPPLYISIMYPLHQFRSQEDISKPNCGINISWCIDGMNLVGTQHEVFLKHIIRLVNPRIYLRPFRESWGGGGKICYLLVNTLQLFSLPYTSHSIYFPFNYQNHSFQEFSPVVVSFLLINALTNEHNDSNQSASLSRIYYTRLVIVTFDDWVMCDAV
jgi:hypothetical protein